MDASAGVEVVSKPAPSAKKGGAVTRKDLKSAPLPEEMLEILVDHLKRLDNSGIHIELIPTVWRAGHRCTGFLVYDTELIEGKIRTTQEEK